MNHRSKLKGMDREDSDMGEDMTVEVDVVGREPEDVVLARRWTGEASVNSSGVGGDCEIGGSKGQHTIASRDSNCCSP
jgi:hypothetical protein